eukprot:TRINITY_DN790_c0_g1_i1.p1 TRINITY_DN790_c0_g1~~TRINITY_DN790_c0_g1_i1.p1  ORF type:complete len:522 (+),score=113.22 TRINITY_DN790_c0_g1_i1:79-1644(+)
MGRAQTAAALLAGAATVAAADTRPNLLLLFPDQWRYDWDGMTGPEQGRGDIPLRLPVTKAVAQRGTRFTQAYVPAPVCAPSRSCLASAREYDHQRVPNNGHDYSLNVTTFYTVLRDAGYHTMTTGKDDLTKKTQLGSKVGYPGCPQCRAGDGLWHQSELGFSDGLRYSGKLDVVDTDSPHEMYGFYLQNHTMKTEDGKNTTGWQAHRACMGRASEKWCDKLTYTPELYEDDWTAGNAITLLKRRPRDRPFFLQVSFPGPHPPFLVTAGMRKAASDGRVWPAAIDDKKNSTPGGACKPTGEPDGNRVRCNYAAEIENIDNLFQKIIDEVDSQGVLDNTIIFISSDHGEMLGDHGDTDKSKPWQGSAAVPLIVAGPGVAQGRVIGRPVGTLDMAGTFMDIAGAKPAEYMTAVSLRPLFSTDGNSTYRQHVNSGLNKFRMVVQEVNGTSYKYICCKGQCPSPPSTAPAVSKDGWMEMLINVTADPFDMNDLSKKMPELSAQMRKLLPATGTYDDINYAEGCLKA